MDGRLILDIQPGRANVLDEMNHLKGFLNEPDVDVALDAEWNVGPRGEPGQDLGSLSAKKINKATTKLRKIVNNHDLPPKLLIVHQFREDSVKGRAPDQATGRDRRHPELRRDRQARGEAPGLQEP